MQFDFSRTGRRVRQAPRTRARALTLAATFLIVWPVVFFATASTALAAGATRLGFVVGPPSTSVSGATFNTVTVEVLDETDQPIAFSGAITLSLDDTNSNGGSLSGSLAANPSGDSQVDFTDLSVDKAGTGYKLIATADGLDPATSSAFSITPGAADHLTITSGPAGPLSADDTFGINVDIRDEADNLVTTDNSTQVAFILSGGAPGAEIRGYSGPTTAANGVVETLNMRVAEVGSGYTIDATADSLLGDTTLPFDVSVGALSVITVTTPTEVVAGSSFDLNLTAQDGYENPIEGDRCIVFSGADGSPNSTLPVYPPTDGCSSGSKVTFDEGGAATVSATVYKATATTIAATDHATEATGSTAQFDVADAGVDHFTVSDPGGQVAGSQFSVGINAVDAYGNAAASYYGTECLTFSGANASPGGSAPAYPNPDTCDVDESSMSFDGNGHASANVTLFKAAATSLSVADGTAAGTSPTFAVSSAGVDALQVADPGQQTAGGGFTVMITGQDPYGNPIVGAQCVTFSGAASSPNSTAPTYPAKDTCAIGQSKVTFDSAGSATVSVTLFNAAPTTLTVTDAGKSGHATFTVIDSGIQHFQVSVPNATAGTPVSVSIAAFDQFGNAAATFNADQCVTFSGANSSPDGTAPSFPSSGTCGVGSSVTFSAAGTASPSVTLFKAVSTTLHVTDNSSGSTGAATLSVTDAGINAFTVANPGNPTAGHGFNLAIAAFDQYGNPAATYAGPNCITITGAGSSPNSTAPILPGAGSCGAGKSSVTFSATGTASPSITLYNAASTTLVVTDVSTGKTGSSGAFAVKDAGINTFTVTNPGPRTAGTPFNLAIAAFDAYGNAAATYAGAECIAITGPSNSPVPNNTAPSYPAAGVCGAGKSSVTFSATGTASPSITLFNAASTTLVVTDVPSGKTGSTGPFTVNPAPVDSLTFRDASVGFSFQPIDTKVSTPIYSICLPSGGTTPCATAPTSTSVRVLARDHWGNRVANGTTVTVGSTSAGTGLGTGTTTNGIVDYANALSIGAVGNAKLTAKSASITGDSDPFVIALDLKACDGVLCTNNAVGTLQKGYNQITTSSDFFNGSNNVRLRTLLLGKSTFDAGNAGCGTNTLVNQGQEALPQGTGVQTTAPVTDMLIVISKDYLKQQGIQSRSVLNFNVCVGATWIGTGNATPWLARTPIFGLPVPAKLNGGVYWGLAYDCIALPRNTSNPCIALRTKQASVVRAYFHWTAAQTAAVMTDSDLAFVIHKSSPWDGKAGIYR